MCKNAAPRSAGAFAGKESAIVQTTLNVEGMTCGNCVRHVGDALRGLPGVTGVEVRLDERKAIVQHDPHAAPLDALLAAVRDAGYEAAGPG